MNGIGRLERWTSAVAQLIAIGGAAVAAVAWLSGWVEQQLDERIERKIRIPSAELATLEGRIEELEASAGDRGFGAWQRRDPGTVYEAESDGFVTAFTLGARVALNTGTEDSVATMGTRTRVTRHDGSMVPIVEGNYYQIRLDEGSADAVTAYWLPVR